tara:strand:- start:828 stop:1886 length:1059 start_codon:yes stop_codon:yes gene_type:complete
MSFSIGSIVWTMQAVNYFDFVTQDGHGLKTYFSFILFNFPKIIHRIIPFIFFISLFYILINYEIRNELSIFWMNGVTKIDFTNKVIFLSVLLMIIQIWLGSFVSPHTQFKAREFLKNSNVDFFSSLIKEGKFINVVKDLTIFIDSKNQDGSFNNIFLDDSSKKNSKMIYAKNGLIISDREKKIFKLFDGKVINKENKKINVFKFDQIDFNLADYSSNTIIEPKIQERKSDVLIRCAFKKEGSNLFDENRRFLCEEKLFKEVNQELLKRFYKPLYIPIIALLCCFLIVIPKNNISYEKFKKYIFLITFLTLILSEASLRYSTISNFTSIVYLSLPWISFVLIYLILYSKIKNV